MTVLEALLAVSLLAAPLARCGGTRPAPTAVIAPLPTAASSHSVSLTWKASPSPVVGYFVYRGPAGGALHKLNPTPIGVTQYRDTTVAAGQSYTYATTAVDAHGVESAYSNLITVTIPQ